MQTKASVISVMIAAYFATHITAHADVTGSSTNFYFSGNWPSYQPVSAGSNVPSVPTNIACVTAGSIPFAIGEYGGPHTIAHLNDGLYGNAYSWITTSLSLSRDVNLGGTYGTVNMSFAGVAFSNATPYVITDIVIGRSAANEYQDRFEGNIYIQITTSDSVSAITDTDTSADALWTTLGYYTTSDPYEHMFTFNTPVTATGVRIVTAAGNCIDEIVVHGGTGNLSPWIEEGGFVWTNVTGGAWSDGANWTNGSSPNSIVDTIYITHSPLSDKTIINDTDYGLREGQGYQFGTLNVDATLGDGSPVIFAGDAFYLWLSDINVLGNLILSNAVESYSEVRLNRTGNTTFSEWAPTRVTQSKLFVRNGTLTVEGTVSTAESALPSGAWMHLDASRTNTMSLIDAGNGTYYVQQWNDVNGNGTYAYAEASENRPVWKALNGTSYVDFGILILGNHGGIMNGQTLTWSTPNTGIRAAFLVYSDVAESADVQSVLCSKNVTTGVNFCRGESKRLFNAENASSAVLAGTHTLDSRPVAGTFEALPSGFHVIGITTTGDAAADCFARDHTLHAGGQKLAEVILYDRELTASERKTAEAYLMNKWFANPPPTAADAGVGQAASLTLDSGTTLNTTTDFRTQNLTLKGAVTKSGAGCLTAGKISQAAGTLTLSDGRLAVTGDMLSDEEDVGDLPAPAVHLDASDYANCMTTEVTGEGQLAVTGWSDISTNGFIASAPEYCTPPILVTNGLNGLPYVDFGNLVLNTNNNSHLLWNTTNWNIRTVVMVYSDSTNNYYYFDGRDLRSCFLGNTVGNLDFWRGNEGTLAYSGAHAGVKYGHMAVDGEAALADTYLSVGFHVLSFVTASPVHSDAFARDQNYWSGGQRLAEVLIWGTPLTSPQLRSVEQQLMIKWLGRNRPGYPARTVSGPAEHPWMHLDASDTNSMGLVESGGSLYVQQWNDVRTNGVSASAVAEQHRPSWQANNGFPYVDFGVLGGPMLGTDYGPHLWWNETNTHVRAVFLVYSDADIGYAQNFIGSLTETPPFNRGSNRFFFNPFLTSTYVENGTHSLDYALVDGDTTPLPSGFHVIGIRTYHGRAVKADVFARDRELHAGGQKLAEVLVYNRELTDYEFRQTRRYLMRKWFGADSDQESDLDTLVSTSDTSLDIGAGQTLTCRSQSCPGTLEKRGAGRLVMFNANARSIAVDAGELWLENPLAETPDALSLGSTATVNLRKNAFTVVTLSGSGTMSNGTVTAMAVVPGTEGGTPQTLHLSGDLVLSPLCEIRIDTTATAADQISVTGHLSLPETGTVFVSFPQGTRLPASQRLVTYDTLSGASNLAGWTVELTPTGIYTATLVHVENGIDVRYHPRGTILFVQ